MNQTKQFSGFNEFYPIYLSEHQNRTSRRLHFAGTSISLLLLLVALATQFWWLILLGAVQAYTFAWVGHFVFEHNRPATFKHPWLSFMGDWRMWWQMLTGKISF